MSTVRFEDIVIPTQGCTAMNTPQFQLYKDRVQTYPYVPLVPVKEHVEDKVYRSVVLENSCLKVIVLPELGGRVYSVLDKLTKQELFYNNPEIVMRSIAPRDAWFAGGIEFNFPVGHALHTSTPVNAELVQTASEATVILSNKDRVTGLKWAVRLSLRHDERMLRQDVTLQNPTYLSQPFDYWTNAAVPVTSNTKFLYPTRKVISDEYTGTLEWPLHNNVDLTNYAQVMRPSSFFSVTPVQDCFGVYYPEKSVGVLHFARRVDMPGMKLFTWGNNGDGQMWYKLLCADGEAYAEIQGGVPIDQSERAMLPPFAELKFTEWWVPFDDLSGSVLSPISGAEVEIGKRSTIPGGDAVEPSRMPQRRAKDTNTPWSHYISAYECETQFNYRDAVGFLQQALNVEPDFAPVRVALARVRLKQGFIQVSDILSPILELLPRYEPTRMEATYLRAVAELRPASSSTLLAKISELAMSPTHKGSVLLMLSETFIRERKYEEAQLLLKDLLHRKILGGVSASRAIVLLWRLAGHDARVLQEHSHNLSEADLTSVGIEEMVFELRQREEDMVFTTGSLLDLACDYAALELHEPLIDIILPICPDTPSFQYLKSMGLHQLGRVSERDTVLENIHTSGNDFPWELEVILAIENAIRVSEGAGKRSAAHHFWIAHFYEAAGRQDDALTEYASVDITELDSGLRPSLARYISVRQAMGWRQLGNTQKARYYVEKAASMRGPLEPHIASELDAMLQSFSSGTFGSHLFESITSDHPEFTVRRVGYLLDNDDLDTAIELIENGTFDFHEGKFWPRAYYLKAYVLRAVQAIQEEKFDVAIQALQKAREYPDTFGIGKTEGLHHFEQLNYLSAVTYHRQGKQDDAKRCYELAAHGNAPVSSELYYYQLAAQKSLGTLNDFAVEEWLERLPMEGFRQTKHQLMMGLGKLLLSHPGAKQQVRSALEIEKFTKENWTYQLSGMNRLIPEQRVPPVIWEALQLEVL